MEKSTDKNKKVKAAHLASVVGNIESNKKRFSRADAQTKLPITDPTTGSAGLTSKVERMSSGLDMGKFKVTQKGRGLEFTTGLMADGSFTKKRPKKKKKN